jgi:hypothetical protein
MPPSIRHRREADTIPRLRNALVVAASGLLLIAGTGRLRAEDGGALSRVPTAPTRGNLQVDIPRPGSSSPETLRSKRGGDSSATAPLAPAPTMRTEPDFYPVPDRGLSGRMVTPPSSGSSGRP